VKEDKIVFACSTHLYKSLVEKLQRSRNEEEEEPPICYLVYYYTYDRLNMFRVALYPSSGFHHYTADYHMGRLIHRLLLVGGLVQVGWLNVWVFSPDT
jgi:hypothetical protein